MCGMSFSDVRSPGIAPTLAAYSPPSTPSFILSPRSDPSPDRESPEHRTLITIMKEKLQIAWLILTYRVPAPIAGSSTPQPLAVRMARSLAGFLRGLGVLLRRIPHVIRVTRLGHHGPLRRTILLLLDPEAFALWPDLPSEPAATLPQKLARLCVWLGPAWQGPHPPETTWFPKDPARLEKWKAAMRANRSNRSVLQS